MLRAADADADDPHRLGTRDLAEPLATGKSTAIEIDWSFTITEESRNGRGGRERLKDGWLYEIAQWFPRAAVYDDVNGWQNVQFYGQGEFYLEFGNYDVSITVPHDHIVQATGVLMNPTDVLGLNNYQAGDLNGLAILGQGECRPGI